jgi:peroxiredoxin
MLKIGDQAPAFTLKNSEMKEVSLSDFAGKQVVILFFPLAFTSVCTAELCSVRDNYAKYESLNAVVLGISVDSPFTLAKFKAQENYNFPLLSDFNKATSKAYGAFYEEFIGMHGVSKRSAFVVGTDGRIKYAEVLENAGEQPSFEGIQSALSA